MTTAGIATGLLLCLSLIGCAAEDSQSTEPFSTSKPDFLDCVDVPDDLCREHGRAAAEGPQPSGSERIARLVVRCTLRPPCDATRTGSGGTVEIVYADGSRWEQDWEVNAGQ